MEQSDKDKILKAFSNKILGIRNYNAEKQEFLVNDFIAMETLEMFLEELRTGESDITPAGKAFLEKYFGFEELAKLLYTKTDFADFASAEQLSSWLKQLNPMEAITFIAKVRGDIEENSSLRSDLLPPEDTL